MWHRRVASRPFYIIQLLSDSTVSNNNCWQVSPPTGNKDYNIGLYRMDASFSDSYYRGGEGGVAFVDNFYCTCVHKVMEWQTAGKKNEKRYGFCGREWTHFSIARPIEAGI